MKKQQSISNCERTAFAIELDAINSVVAKNATVENSEKSNEDSQ